jgi:hypothetical protein
MADALLVDEVQPFDQLGEEVPRLGDSHAHVRLLKNSN